MTQSKSTQVLWLQVWGLAAVQGAILLSWVIYNIYLSQMLVAFGFDSSLAASILVIENILAALMEPLMGTLSDNMQYWLGSRFPFITFGIILASACFILIPTIFVFGGSTDLTRILLPIMMVLWALAMTIFRSPVLSLLGRYATDTNLPQAASILTLVAGIIGAITPLSSKFILQLGPVFTFSLGSVVMLIAAALLRWAGPNRQVEKQLALDPHPTKISNKSDISLRGLLIIFVTGMSIVLGFRLLMQNFAQVLKLHNLASQPNLILITVFLTLALAALPMGRLAKYLGNHLAMISGLIAMAIFSCAILLSHNVILATTIAIALGISFSLVSNNTIPFALSMVPEDRGGLGTGMYFSGNAAANILFILFLGKPNSVTLTFGVLLSAITFLIAMFFVARRGNS
ncbi:MAG: MFS transporter [Microcoleaceae cyanobacterium]